MEPVPLEVFIQRKEDCQRSFFKFYLDVYKNLSPTQKCFAKKLPIQRFYRFNQDLQLLLKFLVEFIIDSHLQGNSCGHLIEVKNISFKNGDFAQPILINSTGTPLPDISSEDYSLARNNDYIQLQKFVKFILDQANVVPRTSTEVESFIRYLEEKGELEILNHWALWNTSRREIFLTTFHNRMKESKPGEFSDIIKQLTRLGLDFPNYLPKGGFLDQVYNHWSSNYSFQDARSLAHFIRNSYQHIPEHTVGGTLGKEAIDTVIFSSFPTFLDSLCNILGDKRLPSFWVDNC